MTTEQGLRNNRIFKTNGEFYMSTPGYCRTPSHRLYVHFHDAFCSLGAQFHLCLCIFRDSLSCYSAGTSVASSAKVGRADTAYSFAVTVVVLSSLQGSLVTDPVHRMNARSCCKLFNRGIARLGFLDMRMAVQWGCAALSWSSGGSSFPAFI